MLVGCRRCRLSVCPSAGRLVGLPALDAVDTAAALMKDKKRRPQFGGWISTSPIRRSHSSHTAASPARSKKQQNPNFAHQPSYDRCSHIFVAATKKNQNLIDRRRDIITIRGDTHHTNYI
jgi:streptomycin 6-kinase